MGFSKERLGAVFFAVLMVTSLVAMPALASGPSASAAGERTDAFAVQTGASLGPDDGPPGRNGGGPPGHDRGDANVTIPDLEENTTLEAIVTATERLGDLEIEGDDDATAAANDTVEAVNASLQEYRRARYADSRAAFGHLAEAQRALATLRDDVDGSVINRLDGDEADAAGRLTARHGDNGARLLRDDICNSPCKSTFESVNEYRGDGLTTTQTKQLLQAYTKADDVTVGPSSGRNGASNVQSKIDDLDGANAQGVRRSMRSASNDVSSYKGLAGEVDIADRVRKSNVDGDDIELQQDIPEGDVPDGLQKQGTEIDVNVDSEVTIDGQTLDSPAIESKNYNPDGYSEFLLKGEQGEIDQWSQKLAAQARASEDTLVLVTTREFKNAYGELLDELPQKVQNKLDDAGVDANPTVKVTTYENVGS